MIGKIDCKERIRAVFDGQMPDRTPALGGWLAWPPTVAAIAGVEEQAYWEDPLGVSVKAYRALECDGLVSIRQPEKGEFRLITHQTVTAGQKTGSPEAVRDIVRRMPSPEQILRQFDVDAEYEKYIEQLNGWQQLVEPMLWLHTDFDCGANFQWYIEWGFEPYLAFCALYPDEVEKLFACSGAMAYCRSRIVARAIEEGKRERVVFIGQDICGNMGPLISPQLLERYYFPNLRYGFQPLLEVGAKIVWHCDGDCRLIVDRLLEAGVAGFQGFQSECGMELDWIAQKRARNGEKLIIFGPISVTRELQDTPMAVEQAVRRAIQICKDKAHLLLFTSTTVEPEVPVENIWAMYKADRAIC